MVIAIDGTSGSGKSTVAKRVAERTSFRLLNTGLLYRRITRDCLARGIKVDDVPRVVEVSQSLTLPVEDSSLHRDEISRWVPAYARIPEVRAEVRRLQQNLGRQFDLVVEGRDIGTVVFPDAEFKFFITASLEERARRRQRQLGSHGGEDLQTMMKSLEERDHQDEHRSTSPLTLAVDAVSIDTTTMAIDEVVETILAKVGPRLPQASPLSQ